MISLSSDKLSYLFEMVCEIVYINSLTVQQEFIQENIKPYGLPAFES
jgi:hypothetical protein